MPKTKSKHVGLITCSVEKVEPPESWESPIYKFRLNIDPREIPTAQQKGARIAKTRTGSPYISFYTKPRVREIQNTISLAVRSTGVLRLFNENESFAVYVAFVFNRPKSATKLERIRKSIAPVVVRPDVDNLTKNVLDAFTDAGAWRDDSLIWSLQATKHYNENDTPHIDVYISPTNASDTISILTRIRRAELV